MISYDITVLDHSQFLSNPLSANKVGLLCLCKHILPLLDGKREARDDQLCATSACSKGSSSSSFVPSKSFPGTGMT